MKRFALFFCALLLALAGTAPAQAAGEAQYISAQFYDEAQGRYGEAVETRQVGVSLNGEEMTFDMPAVIRSENGWDGRTLVPVRPIAEALGAEVLWIKESRQVVISNDTDTITLTLGSAEAVVNGQSAVLPGGVPACVAKYDGVERTLVPLRFVSEQLHAQVDWDNAGFSAAIAAPWLLEVEPPQEADGLLLRVENDDNAQTITLRLNREPRCTVTDLGDRVAIDLYGFLIGVGKDGSMPLENLAVKQVRYAWHGTDISSDWASSVRVVLDLTEGCSMAENLLIMEDKAQQAIVIQTFPPEKGEEPPTEVEGPADALAFTVVLDAGHGGKSPGAVYEDILEKTITLPITLRVGQLLQEKGHNVVFTRSGDEYIDLYGRCDVANAVRADVFVSIHANASVTNRAFQGTFTYSYPGSAEGKRLAGMVQSAVVAAAGSVDRGLLTNDYVVLRETRMPAALLETGFMSCPEELARLIDPEYQEKLAQGTANGIHEYLSTLPAKTAESVAEREAEFQAWEAAKAEKEAAEAGTPPEGKR